MSGGSYYYKFYEIENLADLLFKSDYDKKYQPIRNKMASALLEIAAQCRNIEWTDSNDYGEEQWTEIEKWLKEHNF